MTTSDVNEMVGVLSDMDTMRPLIRAEMAALQRIRRAYVSSHADEFPTTASADHYMRDWVANFELSDVVSATRNPAIHLYAACLVS